MMIDWSALAFRDMKKSDLAKVMEIEPRAYAFHWSEQIFIDNLNNPYTHSVVLHDAQRILGYAVFSVIYEDAQLLNIAISPEYTGKGLGGELLDYVIKVCKLKGATHLILEVRPSNAAANRLYEAKGFYFISVRKNYYPTSTGREDGHVMGLKLTA